ncbi:low molecular weight protein-tyrosine-phosphatase [Azospirillum isscasi]|uniref:protein-tyrosine-phosphatase n=1 Tax=Azospirillum isscasi TaxID=3053926 RepID=A0ABU0WET4_9PROT|nr:low molecular weight protein-tyrosine-phosphatase [Azospirillum isscasi]MDQ2102708.1 low molecular weight protein-tyrosine-phosphatase [Azospirillum isscasi]
MTRHPQALSVLFVCTGNICRSPTAEGLFRAHLRKAGLDGRVSVDSAGTHGYHAGEPPDPRSIEAARRRGADLSPLRARQVSAADFERFDLILALDRGHLGQLRRMAPPGRHDRLHLFLDFAAGLEGRDVPDPYYGDEALFAQVLDLIDTGARALLAEVGRRLDRDPAGAAGGDPVNRI